ncbi:MAG: 30S ribosomal protein S4 [bacterium]|nr:30S ribosomal protein S4 [bacterium]
MKIGPKYKIGKRLGASVFEKCQTQKFMLSESRTANRIGRRRKAPRSDYGKQFLEKQKVRYTYGVSEKQFKNYIKTATDSRKNNPSEILFRLLENRLDNVVYRMGLSGTRRGARQMVSHGHVLVNNHKVTIPSYHISAGDMIAIRDGSKNSNLFVNLPEKLKEHNSPSWVSYDEKKGLGKVSGLPTYQKSELAFDLSPVLEFYSR